MIKKILPIAILLLSIGKYHGFAQEKTVLKTNPPSVKWQEINTSYFQIIYPENYRDEANRVANVLAAIYEPVGLSLGEFPKKTTVIIQNRSSVSNAFVTWAPRRTELNTMSTQDYNFLGVNDWVEMIAVHEQRHVIQQEKSITGFNKVMYYLFGEATTGGFSTMAVPYWFWEGDAVCMETAITPTGRGRIPEFNMAMRTNLLEKGAFNYNKQYLRSFKDYIPNHYVTGYYFTAWLREKYGPNAVAKMTKNAWSWSFVPFTFSNAMNKQTGNFLVKNYNAFIADLKEEWSSQLDEKNYDHYNPINQVNDKAYTSYKYPYRRDDGKILALKSGIGDITTVVLLDKAGNETKIAEPGLIKHSGMFSANERYATWVELEPDPRWPAQIYSVIKLLNIDNGNIRKITEKSRYAAAAISHQGDKIAAIEEAENGDVSIVVLSTEGEELQRYEKGKSAYYHMPSWSQDDSKIIFLKNKGYQKSIVSIEPATGKETILLDAGKENVGYPKKYGNLLFYNSPLTGIDNIYVKNLETSEIDQFTHAKYGAFNAHYEPASQQVYFNDYQVDGYNVVSSSFEQDELKEVKQTQVHTEKYADIVTRQEGSDDVLEEAGTFDYPYEEYSKLKHIINPHSWGITLQSLGPQFKFFVNSQDLLSTTTIGAGYIYNANEQTGAWEVDVSYQNFFPIIDFSFRDGKRRVSEEFVSTGNSADTLTSFEWEERGIELGVRVPLNLTRNKYFQRLNFEFTGAMRAVKNYGYFHQPDDIVSAGYLNTAGINVSYQRMLKRSKRDINSRLGQKLSFNYQTTPVGGDFESNLFAVEGELYLPGLAKHHSLWFRGGYQYEDKVNYVFESPLTFPRGFNYSSYDYLYTAAANYAFPVWYPDVALGPVVNFQRVRANVFYDYAYGFNYTNIPVFYGERYYHTVGMEVNFDLNIMRFLPMIDIGFRYNYKPQDGTSSYNILIGNIGI